MDALSNNDLPIYYSDDWKAWQDPECPEYFDDPTSSYLDRHAAGTLADKTALICDDQRLSYRELLEETCRFASGFAAIGCQRESRMLFFGTDSIEYVAAWLGAVRSGLVPVVVSDAHKDHHLKYFLDDTGAATLLIDEEQLPKLASIAQDVPTTLARVLVRGSAAAIRGKLAGIDVIEVAELRAKGAPQFTAVRRHRHDLCYMFYSGGTTGTPKGVTHLTHDLLIVPERHSTYWEYVQDDIVHGTSKKSFTHGLWPGVLIPLYCGATSVISRAAPVGNLLVDLIEKHRPTKLVTVPTVIKLLLAEVDRMERKPDFSSLKFVVAASEKMAPELFERFYALTGIELMDSIGSSEVTYEWIANRQKDYRRGSLGKPVFGVQIKLTDEQGNEIREPNKVGDVWVNSVTRCFFYWRKLEQTQSTFHGPWTRTGDQLYFDEDGYFWFASRSDDVFKVKGLWVSPTEVEAVITSHPAVLEAAVIGVETSDGMMTPRAFVVLKKQPVDRDAVTAELADLIRTRIGGYKVPDRIEFMQELPRTPLMKISRKALRDALKEQ